MHIRFLKLLQFAIVTVDLVTIALTFLAAVVFFSKRIDPDVEYVYFGLALPISWLFVISINKTYSERNIKSFENLTNASAKAFLYVVLIVTIYLFFFRLLALSRLFIISVLAANFIALMINRVLYFAMYNAFNKKRWFISKVVVIGYNAVSKRLVDYLAEDGSNKEVVGFCEDLENVHELSRYPILSPISDTLKICKQFSATEIYSTISPESNISLYKLMQAADDHCIRFRIVPDLRIFYNHKMHIDHLKEIVIITPRKEPLDNLGNRIIKRLMDIGISLFVIAFLLSWLVPVIGLLIWFESRGPIFFKQQRTGRDQATFSCLKFRSMRLNDSANTKQAVHNDDRITSIGAFLRRTSLDEMPQFINVLMGDMSIVGPRPHMLRHTSEYSRTIGQYMVRQFLKPGITGWAQVNGYRGEIQKLEQMQKRIEHDLWYMENWSILIDIKIILMTAFNVIHGEENAY